MILTTRLAFGWLLAPIVSIAVGCADKSSDDDDLTADVGPDGEIQLDPSGDEDGDGHSNGDEAELGSDPLDPNDVPYAGGWKKSRCPDDLAVTGDGVGQTPDDFALVDQYGEEWHLHDFCDSTVMLEFSGFT